MKKKLQKKLSLNKESVLNLNTDVKAGTITITFVSCLCTGVPCLPTPRSCITCACP